MKRWIALFLALLMLVGVMSGCSKTVEVWESYSVEDPNQSVADGDKDNSNDEDDQDDAKDEKDNADKTTKRAKKTTTKKKNSTANVGGAIKTRAPKDDKDMLNFTPEADAGAKYDIKGTVSIAVDTVRPTDYDAMFDIMQKLYPNIKFEFDEWAHGTNDDGREYLNTRFNLGTNANIMWDEAGEMPSYTMKGYVYPITQLVKSDPEAKNLSANLVSDYTYAGELYAVPHQATFELVAFNLDLLQQAGLEMPGMEWSLADKEKYLKAGADLFNKGKCVGMDDLFETYKQVSYYWMTKDGIKAGPSGWSYDSYTFEVEYLKKGALQFRAWRVMQPGVEGWYESTQNNEQGVNNLQDKLGVRDYTTLWSSGKALIDDTLTAYTDKWSNLRFKWDVRPTPNVGGQNIYHVDQCFITANTPKDRVEACYQALRFMSFSTNGNLARLTMYEKSQEGKYNLHSRIYYPTTQSKKVLDKFYSLDRVTETDKYLVRNIPKCSRYDAFKIVPYYTENWSGSSVPGNCSKITDGLADGTNLNEPVANLNQRVAQSQKQFAQKMAEVQAEFKKVNGQ